MFCTTAVKRLVAAFKAEHLLNVRVLAGERNMDNVFALALEVADLYAAKSKLSEAAMLTSNKKGKRERLSANAGARVQVEIETTQATHSQPSAEPTTPQPTPANDDDGNGEKQPSEPK